MGSVTASLTLTQCGVENGVTFSGATGANANSNGCLIGNVENVPTVQVIMNEVFCTSSVQVECTSSQCGGMIGTISSSVSINNSYTEATVVTVSGGYAGGIAGSLMLLATSTVKVCNSFVSSNISSQPPQGFLVGSYNVMGMLIITNVLYNNQNAALPAVGSGAMQAKETNVMALNCSQLFSYIATNFESSIWGGNSTKSPNSGFVYNGCNCGIGCSTLNPTFFSTTQMSSTKIPATQLPTSPFPSTISQTSLTPTRNTPSATISLTKIPSTSFPPSTNSPSTNSPSQSSIFPSTNFPSSSLLSSTHTQSTVSQTVHQTFLCAYQVSNCHNCTQNAPLFDLTQGNVSCVFSSQQNEWIWTFTPNTGTLTNVGEIVLSGNTTIFVEGNLKNNASLNISSGSNFIVSGNFTQNSGGQIVFTFNPQQNNNKSSPLNVGGCISINGNITLNLQTQTQQGTTNFQLISYNCSQQVNISSSQIQVTPNYNGSSCDTINSQTINQPGTLGISMTSTLGTNAVEETTWD